MAFGRTSRSFMVSVIVHAGLALVLGLYMLSQTELVQDLIQTTFLEPKKTEPPKPRKPVVKPVLKPVVPTESTVVVEQVQVQPRMTTSAVVRPTSVRAATVLEFSNQAVKITPQVNPNVPRVVTPNRPVPQVVTTADLPISDAPGALDFAAPVASGTGGGPPIGRGVVGVGVQASVAHVARPAGLTMVQTVGAVLDGLGGMVDNITLGSVDVKPLPKGEPGGRVIGKGKDIQGVFRFTRVRHSLSDWWADASSLNALAKWLNERTKIKADMNVEGGAVKLTDVNMQKSPMLFMTGHDPSLVQSRNLMRGAGGGTGGKLDKRLSETEAANLRKYLVERGGFLVFDDCGVNAPAQAMIKLFLAQLRFVMPEYQVERVQNDHLIYNNFYEMGGPPVGFDIFWWGTHPPKRNYLEGVSVDERLAALVVRRDYMCAMEAVSLPTRSVHYSPGVYRFMTNVVVYSLTHGEISDYKSYVPEDTLAKQAVPTSAPETTRISATPLEEREAQ